MAEIQGSKNQNINHEEKKRKSLKLIEKYIEGLLTENETTDLIEALEYLIKSLNDIINIKYCQAENYQLLIEIKEDEFEEQKKNFLFLIRQCYNYDKINVFSSPEASEQDKIDFNRSLIFIKMFFQWILKNIKEQISFEINLQNIKEDEIMREWFDREMKK
ncbi:MAG TPA: hypothetical protein PLA41_01970 [Candidatus Pacearchaeota archaeon]|nr:hypothetical protein [Candidatus Pacearchaeota archaeon]HQI74691.1 hypothetical protein [Candidatus Pacearchaeota archaeon]